MPPDAAVNANKAETAMMHSDTVRPVHVHAINDCVSEGTIPAPQCTVVGESDGTETHRVYECVSKDACLQVEVNRDPDRIAPPAVVEGCVSAVQTTPQCTVVGEHAGSGVQPRSSNTSPGGIDAEKSEPFCSHGHGFGVKRPGGESQNVRLRCSKWPHSCIARGCGGHDTVSAPEHGKGHVHPGRLEPSSGRDKVGKSACGEGHSRSGRLEPRARRVTFNDDQDGS